MNKKSFILIVSAAPLLLAGCGAKNEGAGPVRVRLEQAAALTGQAASYYSGTIEARNSIPLGFLTAGTISDIPVREGQAVEKGQLLGTLDCQNNQSALRMAEAKNKQAQDAFRRFEPMYNNGNLAEIKMVEIETARTQAEQGLKLAQKNAADCAITAPASGIISRRDAEAGSSAIPGKTVLRLESVDQVYAVISVPEREISAIKRGSWAEVEVAALTPAADYSAAHNGYRDTPSSTAGRLRGVVTDSGVSADPLARTYTVRVLLNNPGRRMLPGMICGVYTGAKGRGGLALVPGTAINIDESDRQYVYTVAPGGNIARKRPVETSGFARGGVIVARGLKAGEMVVSEGAQKLSDGAAITAEEAYGN